MEPLEMAIMAALASSGMSALGNISQSSAQERENRPTRDFQKRRNSLIDELLSSIEGGGRFSDLFATDDDAFQRSIVDPAKQRFSSQIAPQIQQSAIAGGAQFGSGLQDDLTRAGVDMDSLINQQYLQFQQGGQDRISGLLNSILGQQAPTPFQAPPTPLQTFGAGGSGFLQSKGFAELAKSSDTQRTGFADK